MPPWRRATTPLCGMTHRNLMEVARSLASRNGMPVFSGLALWKWHQRSALERHGRARPCLRLVCRPRRQRRTVPCSTRPPGPRGRAGARLCRSLHAEPTPPFDALEQAIAGSPGADDDLAVAAAAPMSAQATEILTTLARHRGRRVEMERRDFEFSQWTEHLQPQLDACPPLA